MKDGEERYLSTEVLWITSDLVQGFGNGSKENVVYHLLVLERELLELFGDGKYDMEIGYGEEFGPSSVQPPCTRSSETLRAGSMSAGVIKHLQVPTLVALFDMTTQSRGSAVCY